MKRKGISTKRGRKKLLSNIPTNYYFWYSTISNPNDLKQFLERGNERQINCVIRTLNYMQKFNREKYEMINGEYWLKVFKSEG